MAIRSIAILKSWFSRGKYPTAEQFADWLESFWHKTEDKIPISAIDELADRLNAKYDKTDGEQLEKREVQLEADFKTHEQQNIDEFKQQKAEIDALKNSDKKIEADIAKLQADDKTMQGDIAQLKTDESKAQADIAQLQADDKTIQGDITTIEGEIKQVNTDLSTKQDKSDMPNYLKIAPDGLQDGDIAIRQGGSWVRKQASDISTIHALTVQQNGKIVGTFDGVADETINIQAVDAAELANYLKIAPDGLQDGDIAIRQGGSWVRKPVGEAVDVKPLTVQQNGQTIGTFDGRAAAIVNVDAAHKSENTYANINKNSGNDTVTGIQFCDRYGNNISGVTIVRGQFTYAANDIVTTPYGSFNTASATSLLVGMKNSGNYQSLFMVGANAATPDLLTNELLLLDVKPEGYNSGWTRMLTDHNFKALAPTLANGGTWNIDVNSKNISAENLNNIHTIKFNQGDFIDTGGSFNLNSRAGIFHFLNGSAHAYIYCKQVITNQSVNYSKNLSLRYDPVNYIKQSERVEIYWNSEIKSPEFDVESVQQNLPDLITDNKDEEGNITSHSLNVQAILMAKLAAMENIIKKQDERINALEERLGKN